MLAIALSIFCLAGASLLLYYVIGYRSEPHRFIPWIIPLPAPATEYFIKLPVGGSLGLEDISTLLSRTIDDIKQICVRVNYRPAMQTEYTEDIITYYFRPFNKPRLDKIRYRYLLSLLFGNGRYFMYADIKSNRDEYREVL